MFVFISYFNNIVLFIYNSYTFITLKTLLLLICKSACESIGLDVTLKPEWKSLVKKYLVLQYLEVIPITHSNIHANTQHGDFIN